MATMLALLSTTLAAPVVATDTATYRFIGHGTDHGVGLSQRGAAGRAKAGQTYDQILSHYFPGTALASVSPDTTIRALIVKDYRPTATETPLARGMLTAWTIDSPAVAGQIFPARSALVLLGPGSSGPWSLQVRASLVVGAAIMATFTDEDADLHVTPVPPTQAGDAVGHMEILVRPSARYDRYQGSTRIARKGKLIRVVNEAPIESFVRSVVPREMGPSNLLEALKSQAVSARSYFLAGVSSANPWFDVQSYRDSQSFRGTRGEDAVVSRAVDATAFQVLTFKGTTARTFYHAVGGGATEASANVFTGPTGKPGSKTAYLRGGADVDEHGVPYDHAAADFSWATGTFTLEELSAMLAHDPRTDVGTLTAWPIGSEAAFHQKRAADPRGLAPVNRGVSGRLTWVVLHGTAGTKRVAGWLFKSVFNAFDGSGPDLGSTMIFLEAVQPPG